MISQFPIAVFLFTFFGLWLSVMMGTFIRKRQTPLNDDQRADFTISQGATLTLLGLIIGFTFSMSLGRYDQRKLYEEAEANVIGTEFLRADLLPDDTAVRVRELLKKYLNQRIAFFETRDKNLLAQLSHDTSQLQKELWSVVRAQGVRNPSPTMSLVLSGMNEVLDAEGRTQSAFWNRIPDAAWLLMGTIAILSCLMIGSGARTRRVALVPVLPLVIATAFLLISDLDSPRAGITHVKPYNLLNLATFLNSGDAAHPAK